MTPLEGAQFAAIVTTALASVPGVGQALELPNRMRLSRIDYLIVQQVYRGWAFAGIVVIAALIATGALALMTREPPAYAAFALLVGTQAIFWIEVFPVNRRTRNWMVAPDEWSALRRQWEYSNALSAFLSLGALVCTTLAVV